MPALGALAAEPTYILVDTAIVGHLGRSQLAALGIAAVVLGDALRDLQLPPVRDDGAGRSRLGRGPGAGGASARRSSALALPRGGHRADGVARRARAGGRRADGRLRPHGRLRGHVPADRLPRAALRVHRDRVAGLPPRGRRPTHAARDPDRRQRRERDPGGALRLRLRLGHRGLGVGDRDRPGRDGSGVRRRADPLCAGRPASAGAADAEARERRPLHLHPHGCADGRLHARRRDRDPLRRRLDRRAPDRVPALDLPRARARRDRDRGPGARRPRPRRRRQRARLRGERAHDLALGLRRDRLRGRPARGRRRAALRRSRATSSSSSGRRRSGSSSP